jgi:hypothetical protein
MLHDTLLPAVALTTSGRIATLAPLGKGMCVPTRRECGIA